MRRRWGLSFLHVLALTFLAVVTLLAFAMTLRAKAADPPLGVVIPYPPSKAQFGPPEGGTPAAHTASRVSLAVTQRLGISDLLEPALKRSMSLSGPVTN
jgi:hypothetical protein